jgi:putative transposase
MISASDRENAVMLIEEAAESGATCDKACELLGITERTYYRWKNRKNTTDPCFIILFVTSLVYKW